MVFASYNSASYLLPLDNDQSVAFYRNENRLFPTPIGPAPGGVAPPPGRNSSSNAANDMSITEMLTAAYHHEMQQQHHQTVGSGAGGGGGGASVGNIATGDCPFGRVQSPAAQHQQPYHHRFGGSVAMCDDFQPVGYLNGSSNGYYGFVPSLAAPTGGSGGGGGGVGGARGPEPCNNNNVLPDAVNNNRSQHRPVTAANVNGHLSAMHFHDNRNHISCNDAGEQNNNNNSNNNNNNTGDAAGMFHVQPFPAQQLLVRKRKEAASQQHQQHEDEEMDTNGQLAAGQQHPKRRKTSDTEQGWMEAVPFPGSNGGGVLYQHRAEIHEPAMDEMECQDHPHLPAAVNGLQGATATGQQHQLPTSKIQRRDELSLTSSSCTDASRDARGTMTVPLPGHPFVRLPVASSLHPPTVGRFEHGKSGQGCDLDLFHSLHGTGGGFSIGK
ncbi:uncharacterized protein DDB_G0283357-like isoform X1 [Anopheles arabiensis]|uniref:Uncharacterized protein n=1 Tax=Anopheles arabiensis TaxID=7173 RepID=A0A182HQ49_ANOAR|nr:uncharacterized protein DDB_G0283357-like isoform X1 [Anopheles arabiensis]